jgi:hypothetical protein
MSAVAVSARSVRLLELEPDERRSHNRYRISLEVEYTLLNGVHIERLGYGRTVNVSSKGILFEADNALPAGSSIQLPIEWPFLLDGQCALRMGLTLVGYLGPSCMVAET